VKFYIFDMGARNI